MTTSRHEALIGAIKGAAVLRGEFTLRSGKTSSYYIDKYRFTTRPAILRALGAMFAERIGVIERQAGAKADRLVGAELGGIPLVTVAALETGLDAVFVRNAKKGYGTAQRIEGTLNKGDRVVFVEDIATTGGQSVEAIRGLREAGAIVLAVIAVVDRLEGARANIERAGVRFESLLTSRDLGIEG
jgi:orotate phosphoribosyltransferase